MSNRILFIENIFEFAINFNEKVKRTIFDCDLNPKRNFIITI